MRAIAWAFAILGIGQFALIVLSGTTFISVDTAYLVMAVSLIAAAAFWTCSWWCGGWGCDCDHCADCSGGGCCGECRCCDDDHGKEPAGMKGQAGHEGHGHEGHAH